MLRICTIVLALAFAMTALYSPTVADDKEKQKEVDLAKEKAEARKRALREEERKRDEAIKEQIRLLEALGGKREVAPKADTPERVGGSVSIKPDSPAGRYLQEHGVPPADFNSYGSRRGNDRVMTRGTFANIRLRNLLAPGTEGGVTTYLPTGEQMSLYDASLK